MKSKIILAVSVLMTIFSSCKKCETCVPYQYKNGALLTTPDNTYAQTIKLCDKADIDAYESMDTLFIDGDNKPAKFICK